MNGSREGQFASGVQRAVCAASNKHRNKVVQATLRLGCRDPIARNGVGGHVGDIEGGNHRVPVKDVAGEVGLSENKAAQACQEGSGEDRLHHGPPGVACGVGLGDIKTARHILHFIYTFSYLSWAIVPGRGSLAKDPLYAHYLPDESKAIRVPRQKTWYLGINAVSALDSTKIFGQSYH